MRNPLASTDWRELPESIIRAYQSFSDDGAALYSSPGWTKRGKRIAITIPNGPGGWTYAHHWKLSKTGWEFKGWQRDFSAIFG